MSVTTTEVMAEDSIELIAKLGRRSPMAREWPSRATMKEFGYDAARKVEEHLEMRLTKKARIQFLSRFGPSLLCLTFIDDGLRIPLRWSEQHSYMTQHMRMWSWLATAVLVASATTQLSASWLIIRPVSFEPSRVKLACYLLLAFIALQPFAYGQIWDGDFVCRSSTVAGGLLLLILGENRKSGRKNDRGSLGLMAEEMGNERKADQLQLVGRLLLTCMFLFQALFGMEGGLQAVLSAPSVVNVSFSLSLLALSLMVCVGFQAEWSSLILTTVLGCANFVLYPFWSCQPAYADYYRYYFFQTCSVMGGLMLLTLHGPGGLSLDGHKKHM